MILEALFVALTAAAALLLARPAGRRTGPALLVSALAGGILLLGAGRAFEARRKERRLDRAALAAATPAAHRDQGYVGSGACQSCHPDEHRTWHATYHRTMTTVAGPDTVKAPFTGETISFHGRSYRMTREGDAYYAEFVDPGYEWDRRGGVRDPGRDAADPPPVAKKRVVMITGSHHQQVFWVAGALPRQLDYVPIVWLIQDRTWRPLHDVFLAPSERPEHLRLWNQNCIRCHSVQGIPGPRQVETGGWAWDTEAAELGISCEACHGPGSAHVAAHAEPLGRILARSRDEPDPTIVNPARLDHVRASETCGICHGIIWSRSMQRYYERGFEFRPGGRIGGEEHLVRVGEDASLPILDEARAGDPHFVERRFWADGGVRVSGREFNGLVEAPCFQKGEMSCLSCHRMHGADPVDMLRPDRPGDSSCMACHAADIADVSAHTHHPPGSSGSSCMNCHMPHTSWGLLKAIRAHDITSPDLARSLTTGRPNACNLCHLDRSLAWTAEALHAWYGHPIPELDQEQRSTAFAPLHLARGEAGVRGLLAWHLGWQPAQEASGTSWMPGLLALQLDDPYRAVRYVAGRSLAGLDPQAALPGHFDHLAAPALEAEIARLVERARARPLPADPERRRALLLDEEGRADRPRFDLLKALRDHRWIDLAE